jgi:hypothetical protein
MLNARSRFPIAGLLLTIIFLTAVRTSAQSASPANPMTPAIPVSPAIPVGPVSPVSPANPISPASISTAQSSPDTSSVKPSRYSLERHFLKNLLRDQKAIWTSPLHLSGQDADYLLPLLGGTAALIVTDHRTAEFGGELSDSPTVMRISSDISAIGSDYGAVAIVGVLYATGSITGDDQLRETGLLSAESLIGSGIVALGIKYATRRPVPGLDGGRGDFFDGGDGFPSGHSVATWSTATIVAREYSNHRWIVLASYGVATLVSVSRFTNGSHFLSDTVVGSAIGYGVGRYVYSAHHDPELDGTAQTSSKKTASKLIPSIAPAYSASARQYGLSLAWTP